MQLLLSAPMKNPENSEDYFAITWFLLINVWISFYKDICIIGAWVMNFLFHHDKIGIFVYIWVIFVLIVYLLSCICTGVLRKDLLLVIILRQYTSMKC